MASPLPPLTALRAFDAAARHMSFARAAEELHVTPAALSFQIKSLEEHLGVPVFRRLTRAVELTDAGRALAPGVATGFDALTAAWRNAERTKDSNVLTLTAGPAFTSKWFAPRMFSFVRDHPEVELRVAAGLRIMDLERDQIDVAIRFGPGPDTGLFSQPLAQEWLTPMMLPEMAQRYPTPQDLRNAPLLHNTSDDFLHPRCDWPAWFRAADINGVPAITTQFSQPDHAIDAALSGAGVVLARQVFGMRDLIEGRLVAPYKVAISTKANFRFICVKGRENRPDILALREWMLAEFQKSTSISDAMTIIPVEDI